jgi:hypothetical protein
MLGAVGYVNIDRMGWMRMMRWRCAKCSKNCQYFVWVLRWLSVYRDLAVILGYLKLVYDLVACNRFAYRTGKEADYY